MEVIVLASELPIICRTCLSENKELYVFKDKNILELFYHVVKVEIDREDQLPQGVCSVCLLFLEKVNEFIETCRTSNEILRSALMLKSENECINNSLVETESLVLFDCSDEDTHNEVTLEQIFQEPVGLHHEIKTETIDSLEGFDDKTNLEEYIEQISQKTDRLQKQIKAEKIDSSNCSKAVSKNGGTVKRASKNAARTRTKRTIKMEQPNKNEIKKENIPTEDQSFRPMFECHTCSQKYSNLKQHYFENPICKENRYNCNTCPKKFSTSYRLKKHLRTHTKENPYQCEKCPKRYRYRENMRRHQALHDGRHLCHICNKGFTQKSVRDEHVRIHTGETPYVCDYCGRRFQKSCNFRSHIIRHKVENGELPKEDCKQWCNECNRSFSSNKALRDHKLGHKGEKNFLCNVCGKGFITQGSLGLHMRFHSGVKPFKCPHCDKSFALKTGLQYHVLIHMGIRPFTCDICNKSFVQRAHLRNHTKTHTGEKPYACTYCGKTFAFNGNLRVHERIHTGETPYVCSVCNVGFYDSTSLKKHQKVHLKHEDIKI